MSASEMDTVALSAITLSAEKEKAAASRKNKNSLIILLKKILFLLLGIPITLKPSLLSILA